MEYLIVALSFFVMLFTTLGFGNMMVKAKREALNCFYVTLSMSAVLFIILLIDYFKD